MHAGKVGFDKVFWNSEIVTQNNLRTLKLSYLSKDGEEGFPGNLNVVVTYQLNNENEFIINYSANTDKKTIVNLTNHSYFNLKGQGNGDILDHVLYINADTFTENNKELVPTGLIKNIKNTPLDFRSPKTIKKDILSTFNQITFGEGFDQNFCLNKKAKNKPELAAYIYEPICGRKMEILTTTPGIQLYTGNSLSNTIIGKGNKPYFPKSGLCLETQAYPDSVNNPNFPSTILNPEELYKQTTILKFSTIK